jgi:hypothetical protein
VGAVSGAAAGAALGGVVGGPVGAMIGAAVGGMAGGLAGKGVAEAANPTEEDAYWRDNYGNRPYAANRSYDELGPAYQYGWEAWSRNRERGWSGAEGDLERGWNQARGNSRLAWNEARHATRDAWDRLENRFASGERPAAGVSSPLQGTSAGLGTYDRVTDIAGTTGVGISPGLSGLTDRPGAGVTLPTITGVDTDLTVGTPETPRHFGESEDRYWREQYPNRSYASSGRSYDDLRPAYQYGYDAAHQYRGRRWEDAQNDLATGWEKARGTSHLAWQDVKDAVRDAWHRVERALPGDADGDGR